MARSGEFFSTQFPAAASRDSLYLSGSQSKAPTAFIIAQTLAKQGIGLDQPVAQWWPRAGELLPASFAETTAAQLLSHRSHGFALEQLQLRRPDQRHLPLATPLKPKALAPYLRSYQKAPQGGPWPFVYSDISYALLALAIEESLGLSLAEAMADCLETRARLEIFLGFSNVPQERQRDVVSGIASVKGRERVAAPCDLGALNPALGLVASAQGLARLYAHLMANQDWLKTSSAFAQVISPLRDQHRYSLGLTHFNQGTGNSTSYGHVGIYNGCTGATIVCGRSGLTLSLQLNRINLRTQEAETYRMIYPAHFLMALRKAINDPDACAKTLTVTDELLKSLA
ncbi:MAG: serine hydrolase domain-containing protein [Pseudomonadota bacterium]